MNHPLKTNPGRRVSILLGALGGQGGGVLTEWIVGAATSAGYAAQSTSIPGVAQRTGATTYYIEIFPERIAELPPGETEPVFSLFPTPGDVDVIIAGEFLEAARMLEMDFASPARTTLLTSVHRLYAIGEKSALGDGIFPRERIEQAARALTRRVVAFDALAAARSVGSEANAVLLGAFAALQAVPLTPGDFVAAIREAGVAAERNLAGFAAGLKLATSGSAGSETTGPALSLPAWEDLKAARAEELGSRGPAFLRRAAEIETAFPAALHALLGEAAARTVDYQDDRYAGEFLARVRRLRALNQNQRLTEIFARRLAVWMTYEDAVRVAELKTRRARFDHLRREHNAQGDKIVEITDFLKPDLDELYGLLPARLAAPMGQWAERRWPERRPAVAQRVKTTSIAGFLRVWALARLRRLRPASLRRAREFGLLERWQASVLATAELDTDLACEVAELAALVKGYGEVRRSLSTALSRFLDEILSPAVARDRAAGAGFAHATRLVRESRRRLLADETGIDAVFHERGHNTP
ncbi:MAG: indolepyruvate oxidoreductase subunit beta family protein [Blastocatellia bacterium]|nr:indolepyruvate oxidoreductase subunit beta family protein [Blastocatellia bacterium]